MLADGGVVVPLPRGFEVRTESTSEGDVSSVTL